MTRLRSLVGGDCTQTVSSHPSSNHFFHRTHTHVQTTYANLPSYHRISGISRQPHWRSKASGRPGRPLRRPVGCDRVLEAPRGLSGSVFVVWRSVVFIPVVEDQQQQRSSGLDRSGRVCRRLCVCLCLSAVSNRKGRTSKCGGSELWCSVHGPKSCMG